MRLQIDGRSVVDISFAAAHNVGFLGQNPYGLVLLGTVETIGLGHWDLAQDVNVRAMAASYGRDGSASTPSARGRSARG